MKKIILITINSLFIILLIAFILVIASEKRAERLYEQGMAFEAKEDFQNAYYNFSKISIFSRLYPLGLYKQAQNAQSVGDDKTALSRYKAFLRHEKDNEIFAPVAYWRLGNIYINQEKNDKAMKVFEELQKKFPNSDYSYASNYFLGNIKGNKDYYIKYIEYAPGGRFSKNSIMYIENLNENLSQEENIILAKALFQNESYEKSLNYLRLCDFQNVWLDMAKNYEKMGQIDMAQRTYLMGLGELKQDSKYTEEEIQSALNSYVSYFSQNKKAAWESIINIVNTKENPAQLGALFGYATYLPDNKANEIYAKIYNSNPESYYAPSSLAEIIYYNYKIKNYNESIKLGKIQKEKYIYSKATPKALFWSAKSAIKLKDKTLAKEFLNQIVTNNPNDYYAYRANELLYGKKIQNDKTKIKENSGNIQFPYFKDGKIKFYIDRLVKFGDIKTLNDIRIDNKFIQSWIAYKEGRSTYSNILAREGMEELKEKPDVKDSRWKLLYPIYFSDLINKNAQLFNISPYLILSIIKEESHFDKNAKSPVGAIGLMQIMPSTAQMIGGANYDNLKILDEDYNIYLGTKYFSDIIKKYNNKEFIGVLSYNGGPNAVKKWIEGKKINDFDEFIEEIPYPETKNYFKKVYTSYYNYLRIYN